MAGEPGRSFADDLWEHLPVALYRTTPDGRLLAVNQEFVALLGYADRDSLLRVHADALYADPADRVRWGRLLDSADVVRGFETRLRRADGSMLWVRETTRAVREADGSVRSYEGMVEDVNERKQTEEALRASEARYRLLVDRSLAGVYRTTLDGRILECNDAFARIYGYASRADLQGGDAHELYVSPAAREAFIARLRQTGQIVNWEFAGRRRDGSTIWTLETASLIDAEPPGVIEGTLVDVTDRQRAEAALRLSQAQWSQFLEASPDPVWLKDDGGRYVAANDALLRLWGWRREALLGTTDRDIWPDGAALQAVREAIAVRTGACTLDVTETTLHGTRTFTLTVVPLLSPEQRTLGTLGVARDVTERRQAEQALRASEERYRALLERIPVCVHEIDASGRLISMNAAGLRMLGLRDEAQISGRAYLDAVCSADQPRVAEALARAFEGQASRFEFVTSGRSGQRVFAASLVPVRGEDGAIHELTGVTEDITERRQAEAALRESAQRLELALWGGGLGMWDRDFRSGRVVRSALWAELLGYAPSEVGTSLQAWLDLIHVDDKPRVLEADAAYLEGRTPHYSVEYRIRTKLGDWKWVLDTGKVVARADDGSPLRMVGTLMDVTERRRVEEQLKESEKRFRSLADAAFEGVAVTDAGRVVDVNRQAAEMLGYTQAEMIGRPVSDFVAPESVALVEERMRAGWEGTYEHLLRRKDGSVFPTEAHARALPYHGRQRRVTALRDISERKRAEEEQARLTRAVEQAGESIVITAPDGAIVYVNPAFERITGYTRHEALGLNPRLLKSGRQDQAFYRRMWETLASGGVWSGRFVNRRKDGTLFEEDATIGPVHDAAGRLVNYVAVKRDVSAEALLQQQLMQSQKMEAVGRLAGGVAHDFNNMLGVIIGYGEIVGRGLPPESPLLGKLAQILKAAERAAALTRQLLAFSRQQVLQLRVLDLNAVVSDMESMLQRLIGEDIVLVTQLEPGLTSVKADPSQVEQIVMNLSVNSRDAMPQGGQLTIETRTVDLGPDNLASHPLVPAGRYAMLAISDTGSGMDAETQAHIFEPFYTTKEVGKGTGLGLSTVYGIVKQSEGYIWVYSEIGVGTTFKIYLPSAEEGAVTRTGELDAPPPRQGNEVVLLVEDEASLRDVLSETLASNGYRVLMARDGSEALQIAAAQEGPIQLLVTDVIMPRMTGRAVAEQVTLTRPDMKVLFISGYTDDAISRHGVIQPGTAFLSKPFGTAAFLLKVREILDEP